MTQLLALSFDCATSPSIRLRGLERAESSLDAVYGWGLAWYPQDGNAAMVVKDPTSLGTNALTHVLSDWERFSATVFVAHLRGAAKRRAQQDTHPFQRSYGGRDWVLAHNGDLRHGFRHELPLGDDPTFEPMGQTDSEHLFCWLLSQLRAAGHRRLRDVPAEALAGWLRRINRLGTLNLLLSDGTDVAAYSDAFGYRPLWWIRHTPPDPLIRVTNAEIDLKVGTSADASRTAVVVSSERLSEAGWAPIGPGELLVSRRGNVVARSDLLPSDWVASVALSAAERELLRAGDADAARRLSRALLHADAPGVEDGPLSSDVVDAAQAELPLDAPTHPEADVWVPPDSVSLDGIDERVSDRVVVSSPGLPDATAALARAASVLRAPEVLRSGLAHELDDERYAASDALRVLETWHETVYTYKDPVQLSSHVLRLRPVHDASQELLDWRLHLSPACPLRTFEDVFGNHVVQSEVRREYYQLRVVAQARVRLHGQRRPRLRAAANQSRLPLVWMPWQRQMMLPYLLPPELPETQLRELSDYANGFVERQDQDLVATLQDINETIHRDFLYKPASTDLGTSAYDVYAARRGVCQDFSNLFIALARLLNIPARYRVGYIHTGNSYSNTRQGDASHAWVEVYLPGVGWRGFDPTNGVLANDDHVRVACGRNYRDATPTEGTIYKGGGGESLLVRVKVIDVTGTADGRRFLAGDP